MRRDVEILITHMPAPMTFSLAATYWLSQLPSEHLMTDIYPLAFGATILGMGLTLIASFVAMRKVWRWRREGQA